MASKPSHISIQNGQEIHLSVARHGVLVSSIIYKKLISISIDFFCWINFCCFKGRASLDSHSSNTVPLGEFAREAGAFFESQVPATYRVGVSCSRTCARVDRYLPTYQSPVRRPWRKWGRPVCPAGQPTISWPLRPRSSILSLQPEHFVPFSSQHPLTGF